MDQQYSVDLSQLRPTNSIITAIIVNGSLDRNPMELQKLEAPVKSWLLCPPDFESETSETSNTHMTFLCAHLAHELDRNDVF
jgi:hypothetical protein